jgi:hypothetical protein
MARRQFGEQADFRCGDTFVVTVKSVVVSIRIITKRGKLRMGSWFDGHD